MKPQKGYYSVIQYCPEPSRFEAANVGVLLFCPATGYLKAITSPDNQRAIKFFGREGHDWKRVQAFKKGMEDRLQKERSSIRSLDDLRQFISMRANLIRMSDPRPVKVFDPDKDLAELFEKLVGRKAKRHSRMDLEKILAEKFSDAGLEKKLVSKVKVDVPVLNKEVEMPFGFQNGRFNVINTARFEASNPSIAFQTACRHAVEGRSIYDHQSSELGDMQLIVVGQFRPTDSESPEIVRRVFDDNSVKLFKFDEVPKLIDEIRRTGKEIDGLDIET
ncbi:DUF3037 domain-containing protein [Maioricimonas sp. JC845]|uniref:DUF3037 domain-containing protein n=1 Tax=Maioricimonas sp. JC845 TaxID=3232138 RepID=UPI003459AD81